MSKQHPRFLIAQARAAGHAAERVKPPMAWSAALAAAPWPEGASGAFETEFRRAYADVLVERGIAKGAVNPRKATFSRSAKIPDDQRKTRILMATKDEFAEQDAEARGLGLSWAAWARRKLSQ